MNAIFRNDLWGPSNRPMGNSFYTKIILKNNFMSILPCKFTQYNDIKFM